MVCAILREPLSEEAFGHWIELLASTRDALAGRGGLEGAWKNSAFAGSLDLRRLAVAARSSPAPAQDRPAEEEGWGKGLSHSAEVPAVNDAEVLSRITALQDRGPRERRLLDLLLRLGRTDHTATFLQLLKEIVSLSQEYVFAERFKEAFHMVLFLYREAQNLNALGKEERRDYLLETVRLLLRGTLLSWLVGFIATEHGNEEAEVGEYILRAMGGPVVIPLINALVLEKDLRGRRRLVDVLVAIGPPVVPHAVRMLDDQRWFVVRNMVTILGGISTTDALKALSRLITDPDSRIRREVVRALTQASGPMAESILLALLEDPDPAVRLMAVSSATSHRTPQVLAALWKMYGRVGIRFPEWNLKAQILQTLGKMGLPEAVEHLETVIGKRPLFWRKRWEVVQTAAIQALGDLGGRKARGLLETLLDHRAAALRKAALAALTACGDCRLAEEPCPGNG